MHEALNEARKIFDELDNVQLNFIDENKFNESSNRIKNEDLKRYVSDLFLLKDINTYSKASILFQIGKIKQFDIDEHDFAVIEEIFKEFAPYHYYNPEYGFLLMINLVSSSKEKQLNRPTYTYVLSNPITGLTKIGKSINFGRRRKALENSSGVALELIVLIKEDIERKLHKKYKEFRVKGEWFKLSKLHLEELGRVK